MRGVFTFALVLMSFTSASSAVVDAQAQRHSRPRTGVALSGGGALGLAHIGVLRYLEEHHIPVDELAGTSMGGLVGGLYATGMNSKQITEVVEHADWDVLLNPNPRFMDQPIADKQRWNRSSAGFTMQFGKGLALPRGLSSGEALSLLFSRVTLPYSDIANFDELPTPFRCVATDLVSGKAVVLRSGSLPMAMRATMSIPGIFTPVRWNDMVLVDGGVVQTVPVEVVHDMGADRVIAVAFTPPTVKPEQMKSLPDIMRRTASISIYQNEERSLAQADLVILVDPKLLSPMDYNRWHEIIQAGYEAASRVSSQLSKFELTDDEWAAYTEARAQRMRAPRTPGRVLRVDTPAASFQRNATSEVRRELDDRSVSPEKLEDVLRGVAAATAVPSATYEWQNETGKQEGYRVTIAERPGDQVLVRPSFHYGLSPGEPSQTALKLSTAIMFQNAYKSRLLGTLNIGYDPGIRIEYYNPFDGSPYFVAPSFLVQREHVNDYQGANRTSPVRDRVAAAVYAGMGTWRFAQLRLGVQTGYDSYESAPAVDRVKATSGKFFTPELKWVVNSQDSGGLPTQGVLSEGSAGYSFRNVSYPYFDHHFSAFKPIGKQISVFGMTRQGTSFGKKLDYFEQFTAGGQGQLSAFRYQEFHANTLVTTGAGAIVRGRSEWMGPIRPNYAAWYEAGRFDQGSKGWHTHQSASTGVFLSTPLGPLGATLSFDENGKARWRLLLGSL